jgi:hypothetical protein
MFVIAGANVFLKDLGEARRRGRGCLKEERRIAQFEFEHW